MSWTFECEFRRETEDAQLVVLTDKGQFVWFPLSQVEERHGRRNPDGKFHGSGEITVSDWIAEKKGLA